MRIPLHHRTFRRARCQDRSDLRLRRRPLTLRHRTLILLGWSVAVMVAALWLLMSSVTLRSLERLERQQTAVDVQRAKRAIEAAANDLHGKSSDWSSWDDTWHFAIDRNQAYLVSNMTDETYVNLKVDAMVIADAKGRVIYSKQVDRGSGQSVPIRPSLLNALSEPPSLVRFDRLEASHHGILMLPEGPAFLTTRPILNSKGGGPIHGALVFARFLTDEELQSLSVRTLLHLSLESPRSPDLPAAIRAQWTPGGGDDIDVRAVDGRTIAGYAMLKDLRGSPALVLRIDEPRDLYQQGIVSMSVLLWAMPVIAVIFGLLVFWVIERLMLRRLASLSQQVERIGREGITGGLIDLEGSDELTQLGRTFNDSLTSLDATQHQARESESLMRGLFDSGTLVRGVVEVQDDDLLFVMVNESAAIYFGRSVEAIVGKRAIADLGLEPYGIRDWVDRYQAWETDRGALILETEIDVPWGTAVVNQTAFFIGKTPEGGSRFAFVIEDISDRRRIQQETVDARDAAEAANLAKSGFLAAMSHEIRTPMNGVLGMTNLLFDTELTPVQRDYVLTIQQSGEALLGIISDILDFSKIEAGKLTIEPLPFELPTAIDEVCDLLVARASEKHIELVVYFPEDTPHGLVGDSGRIRQVLLNLIGNAIKFTATGHVLVEVERLPSSEGRASLRVHVKDTGIGVSQEAIGRLFQVFSQADASTTRKFGGTGLGLAIVKHIVVAMGGQVGVDSVAGQGSDFWFTLELPLDPERVAPAKVEGLAGKRVLIVDDVELARMHLVERVRRWGMVADSAADGAEALERMREALASGSPYDFALVDLFMPEMDGRQLGAAIRNDRSFDATQIMVLTGRPGRGDGVVFQNAGFDGYLVKPVRDSVLARALAFALETPRGKRAGIITRHSLDEGGAIPPPSTPELARFDGLRVLLAEDNSTNRKIGVRMLEKLGCRVEVAANGVEAVAMAKDFPYDLILMDMQMPEMDGLEATVRIRAMGGELAVLPIVALTANVMESDRNACAQAGMNGFVSKPVKRADLLAALQRWGPDRLEVAA